MEQSIYQQWVKSFDQTNPQYLASHQDEESLIWWAYQHADAETQGALADKYHAAAEEKVKCGSMTIDRDLRAALAKVYTRENYESHYPKNNIKYQIEHEKGESTKCFGEVRAYELAPEVMDTALEQFKRHNLKHFTKNSNLIYCLVNTFETAFEKERQHAQAEGFQHSDVASYMDAKMRIDRELESFKD